VKEFFANLSVKEHKELSKKVAANVTFYIGSLVMFYNLLISVEVGGGKETQRG
jgi:hypothetical protein